MRRVYACLLALPVAWTLGQVRLAQAQAQAQAPSRQPNSAENPPGSLPLRLEPPARHVEPAAASKSAPGEAPTKAKPESSVTSHQKGRAPKTPADTMPSGASLSEPDAVARRGITEGPTSDQVEQGADDPQLLALRAADAVLFPSKLRGIEPGWSWDLPMAEQEPSAARGLPLRPLEVGGADLARSDAEWLRSLTMPQLPLRLDRRVVTYLKFYRDSPRGRTIAAIWAKKSGRYVGAIKAELRRAGLPPDLVWLSMIESGHNPTIASPAGALGLWQFMPHSARMYGLTVDRWVDERRDPARATSAAIKMLGDLHQRFGNWELAMAAYNMGYAGLSRSIGKFNTNDYWTLSRLEGGIPWETTLYVPKIFALAIVMNNRDAFGLGKITPDSPLAFDTILVEPATELLPIARAAGISKDDLAALNPSYLADRLPPPAAEARPWAVRVPVGKGPEVLRATSVEKQRPETILVRQGDDLSTLALDHGASEAEWTKRNALGRGERLEPGTVLLLPPTARKKGQPTTTLATFVVGRVLSPGPGHQLVFYEVRAGDELPQIAVALGVTARELALWNSLDEMARLRDGMTLQVLVRREQDLSRVRHQTVRGAQVLVAGSPEFHEYFEGLRGMQRVEVAVRQGDTLSSIGSRHGMTVGSMERVNRRSRGTKLVPGETVVVYTDRPSSPSSLDGGASPLDALDPPRPDLLPAAASIAP